MAAVGVRPLRAALRRAVPPPGAARRPVRRRRCERRRAHRPAGQAGRAGTARSSRSSPTRVADRASHNVALNGLGNVRFVNAAASDTAGQTRLYRPGPSDTNRARASLLHHPYLTGAAATVPVVTVDDVCDGKPVALIKIDVEGHEAAVVRGAAAASSPRRAVGHLRVRAGAARGDAAQPPFGWLAERGYEMFRVRRARTPVTGRARLALDRAVARPPLAATSLPLAPCRRPHRARWPAEARRPITDERDDLPALPGPSALLRPAQVGQRVTAARAADGPRPFGAAGPPVAAGCRPSAYACRPWPARGRPGRDRAAGGGWPRGFTPLDARVWSDWPGGAALRAAS